MYQLSLVVATATVSYELLDLDTKAQQVRCPVSLELFPLDIVLLGVFLFLDIPLLRMQIDAVDGFGRITSCTT